MKQIPRSLSMVSVGAIILMAAALTADVLVNSTNLDVAGYVDVVGPPPSSTDSVLEVQMTGSFSTANAGGFFAPTTGFAVRGEAGGGAGVYGNSTANYGVWGTSTNSWGGYFSSVNGYGLRVDTAGADHFDHGIYVSSIGGWGLYSTSDNNQAVRGEAGDITGISSALGRVGVVGMGENRGVHASSANGLGIYGTSSNSTGVFGNTSRTDRNYGLYTNDNLFSANINMLGAVMQVAHNGGNVPLEVGDVVSISGIQTPEQRRLAAGDGQEPTLLEGEHVVQVVRADAASLPGAVGVVYSRYDVDAVVAAGLVEPDRQDGEEKSHATPGDDQELEITPPGPVGPGDYLLVVVHGPALVRTDGAQRPINPGDRLAVGAVAGRAVHESIAKDSVQQTDRIAAIGAALEPASIDEEMIFAFVSPR